MIFKSHVSCIYFVHFLEIQTVFENMFYKEKFYTWTSFQIFTKEMK